MYVYSMDYLGEGLLCQAKSILSSLGGTVLWVSRLPSPIHTPKEFPTHHCLHLGLKTLIYLEAQSPRDPNHSVDIVHSYMISSSTSSSSVLPSMSPSLLRSLTSSSSSSWIMDDLIGTESGVYLSSSEDEIKELEKPEPHSRKHDKPNQRCTVTRDYPPPIPLLAQTANFPGRMPWVFTRHYADGKLILKVERVKHHGYFEAHRENGRLILNLVSLDENEKNEEPELEYLQHVEDKKTDETIEEDEDQEPEADYDDNVDETAEEDLTTSLASSMPVKLGLENRSIRSENHFPKNERRENLGKCFTYAGVFNSDSFCNANYTHKCVRACLAQPGSAPLCPMTTTVV